MHRLFSPEYEASGKMDIDAYSHTEEGRYGMWIVTRSGRRVYPLDLKKDDISEIDIAHHLAMLCRWTGACKRHFSIAQHSFHMAEYAAKIGLDIEAQFAFLLHDAAEAYLNDMARPVKRDPKLEGYRIAEKFALAMIGIRFGVDFREFTSESLRIADNSMLITEARQLMTHYNPEPSYPSLPIKLPSWTPTTARVYWYSAFRDLYVLHRSLVPGSWWKNTTRRKRAK